ncbi:putative trypsin-6 [Topomyia yanbarensis]|uniref:putative trypsin-6 n=1 Tax=Topomyia yanbarensis TaxID=2498891 RepID=UPI00273C7AF2|nr:putative trypsin-6 [Topomyia yanbarensis]
MNLFRNNSWNSVVLLVCLGLSVQAAVQGPDDKDYQPISNPSKTKRYNPFQDEYNVSSGQIQLRRRRFSVGATETVGGYGLPTLTVEEMEKKCSASTNWLDGNHAAFKDAAFHASLRDIRRDHYITNYGSGHFCGAVIITEYLLLSAASCFPKLEPQYIGVVVGSIDLHKQVIGTTQLLLVQKTVMHPGYTAAKGENDIGLVILKTPIIFNENVAAAPIATRSLSKEENCQIFGWAALTLHFKPECLLKETVPVPDWTDCNQLTAQYQVQMTEKTLCTRPDTKPCIGDPGGPLLCDGALSGIVTQKANCDTDLLPIVYTDVYKYTDWLKKVTKEQTGALKKMYPSGLGKIQIANIGTRMGSARQESGGTSVRVSAGLFALAGLCFLL